MIATVDRESPFHSSEMATVAFLVPPSAGHVNPTLGLAACLSAHGYRVRYGLLSPSVPESDNKASEMVEWLTGLGYSADRLQLLPRDLYERPSGAKTPQRIGMVGRFARGRRLEREWSDRITGHVRQMGRDLKAQGVDVVLFDVGFPLGGAMAVAAGIPCAQLCPDLSARFDPVVPPKPCGIVPSGWWSIARILFVWSASVARRIYMSWWIRLRGPWMMHAMTRSLRTVVDESGAGVSVDSVTVFSPILAGIPELVFLPESLDFRRHNAQDIVWLGCLPFESASEGAVDAIGGSRTLIVCTFGSMSDSLDDRKGLCQRVIDAIAGRDEFHLVIGGGVATDGLRVPPAAANVTLLRWIPNQSSLLRRAKLAIVHGGFGAIRECLVAGVPMLVLPIAPRFFDRARNGALVEYLGVGRSCPTDRLTEHTIVNEIAGILASRAIQARCEAIRRDIEVRRGTDQERAVAVVEGLFRSEPAHVAEA